MLHWLAFIDEFCWDFKAIGSFTCAKRSWTVLAYCPVVCGINDGIVGTFQQTSAFIWEIYALNALKLHRISIWAIRTYLNTGVLVHRQIIIRRYMLCTFITVTLIKLTRHTSLLTCFTHVIVRVTKESNLTWCRAYVILLMFEVLDYGRIIKCDIRTRKTFL